MTMLCKSPLQPLDMDPSRVASCDYGTAMKRRARCFSRTQQVSLPQDFCLVREPSRWRLKHALWPCWQLLMSLT